MSSKAYYNRPSRLRTRVYDPVIRTILLRTRWSGFERGSLYVLAVRGRRTGREYEHPVGVCSYQGGRYLVSFYGESHWARNVRAGCAAELRQHGQAEPIRGVELLGQEKERFLRHLIRRYPWIALVWWKLRAKRVTDDDIALLVTRYPVFRVEPAERTGAAPQDVRSAVSSG